MPKIFLIKNRLHQQQLRLLESQHPISKSLPNLGSSKDSLLDSSEPLSLIVNKDEYRDKNDDDRATSPESQLTNSPAPSPPSNFQPLTSATPRRFFSSILGGDAPYGSRRHVLTRAERKEYSSPPIASDEPPQFLSKSDKLTLPRAKTPPKTLHVEPPTRVSVIQRVPSKSQASAQKEKSKIDIEKIGQVQDTEPEQVLSSDHQIDNLTNVD